MAVDTRDKRFSMIGRASPSRREQQNPAGTIGGAARAMLLFLYSGIALIVPASLAPADPCDTFHVNADIGLNPIPADVALTVSADSGFSILADPGAFAVPGCSS